VNMLDQVVREFARAVADGEGMAGRTQSTSPYTALHPRKSRQGGKRPRRPCRLWRPSGSDDPLCSATRLEFAWNQPPAVVMPVGSSSNPLLPRSSAKSHREPMPSPNDDVSAQLTGSGTIRYRTESQCMHPIGRRARHFGDSTRTTAPPCLRCISGQRSLSSGGRSRRLGVCGHPPAPTRLKASQAS